MKRTAGRILSFIVAITIFITSIPLSVVYAINPSDSTVPQNSVEESVVDKKDSQADNTESEGVFVLSEMTEKRQPNMKYFRMSDGSTTAVVYPKDVHYANEDGEYLQIDNTFKSDVDENDSVFSNTSNETYVKFMKKSNPNKLYTINKNGYKIKVSIENAGKVQATVEEQQKTDIQDPYVLEGLSGKLEYVNILPNTDIEYTLISNELKENIIIKEKVDFDSVIYNYHVTGSVDVIQNDSKRISVYEKGTQNLIYEITAPSMWDAEGNTSESLSIELTENKNNKFSVKLSFEIPEDAKYPVTVDPIFNFSVSKEDIHDTHIMGEYPNINYNIQNHIRVCNKGYALVKYPLPNFEPGDKIIHSELILTPYCMHPNATPDYSNQNSYSPTVNIAAHKILRSWSEDTATYNNVDPNNNFYDSTITAYKVVGSDTDFYRWDITKIANEWAEGYSTNYGILLRFERPCPNDKFDAFFLATNGTYVPSWMYPAISYQYINTNGVEDYLSYHVQDAGRAGKVYTNDLTGNMTIINNIVQTGGSLMPISVSLVYNTGIIRDTKAPYGYRWTMNWSQKLSKSELYNYGGIEHIKYRDGDGTAHYFKYDSESGTYIDEIFEKRKLTYDSSTQKYLMTDGSGTTMYFSKIGTADEWHLTKLEDSYGNYINVVLNINNPTEVTYVASSTGNRVDFGYGSDGFLNSVRYLEGDGQNWIRLLFNTNVTQNNYSVGTIMYPDGKSVNYHYIDDGQSYISKVCDIDGYSLNYTYTNGSPMRVKTVTERGSNGEAGADMEMRYEPTSTVFIDKNDGWRNYVYSFSKIGTLKSVVDSSGGNYDGFAQFYEYNNGNTETLKGSANLTSVSKVQKSTVNLLYNHSFEVDGYFAHEIWGNSDVMGESSAGHSTQKSFLGQRSYKLSLPASSICDDVIGVCYVAVVGGTEYTLSAYVNTEDMQEGAGGASLCVTNNDGYIAQSEILTERKDGWQRISVDFVAPRDETIGVLMKLNGAKGDVYFDCIQLEVGGLSEYNLVENAGFENGQAFWGVFSGQTVITNIHAHAKTVSLATGSVHDRIEYSQSFRISDGKKGDTYVASAFARAYSVPATGWQFSLYVSFLSNGTRINECNFEFNSYCTEWQKVSGLATASGDYDTVDIWLLYYNNCNNVWFDNAQLVRDTFGTCYTYDEDGNVVSTVDLQGKEDYTFQYNGNNKLIQETNVQGGKIFYGYYYDNPSELNLVSSGGVSSIYDYDSHGNVTNSTVFGNKLVPGNSYYLMNVYYKKFVDDSYSYTWDGNLIKLEDFTKAGAQRWKLIKNADDTYSFSPDCAPGMLLSVEPNTLYDWAPVRLYGEGNTTYQKFTLHHIESNIYTIEVAGQNYSLDGNNNECYVYNTYDTECQQFLFIPCETNDSADNSKITSSAEYSDNGEYMTSQTDSRGNTTSYTYNEKRGYLTSTTNAKDISTNYTYNSSELVTGVNVKQGNNTLSSVGYVYDINNRLSKIQSPSGTEYSFIYDGFGRTLSTKLGQGRTLSSYTYNLQGLPVTMSYGNGTSIQYGYDVFYRQNTKTINNVLRYRYTYDSSSRLSEILDLALNKKTKYSYDLLGRITSEKLIDMNTHYVIDELNLRYDDAKNRLAGYDLSFENYTKSIDYVYGGEGIAPDLVTGVKLNNNSWLSYEYDYLNRLSKRTLSTTTPFVTQYSYLNGATASQTTLLVESVTNGNNTLTYTYDELGNIVSIAKNGTVIESYTYDGLNQLKTVQNAEGTWEYFYDAGGNITSVKKNGTVIKTYSYEDSEWKDLLTKYNGNTITYDAIGNPLSYYNGSTFTWSDGRRLTSITNGNNVYTYVYDEGGQRVSKTVNGVTTNYHWLDGKLQAEETDTYMLVYHYDENGMLVGFTYKTGGTEANYYYVHNLQGDVIGIIDNSGAMVVEYAYDAWGKVLSVTGTLANTIGALNPFRYRDYYYDTETGLYYVFSRYYDPEIGRWISPEPNVDYGEFDDGAGLLAYNVYAYCANNPIMFKDETGEGITLACVLICAGIGLIVGAVGGSHYAKHKKNLTPSDGWDYWKYVVGFGVAGGAVGALVGWGAGALIAKYGVATAATSITKGGGARFSSFNALKRSLGSAGKGRQWHHIVEQCQLKASRAGFSKYWIHNSNNVINLTDDVHGLISNFYSSIPNPSVVNTGGMVFRDWITNMSFEQQYKWGIWVLRYFGVNV